MICIGIKVRNNFDFCLDYQLDYHRRDCCRFSICRHNSTYVRYGTTIKNSSYGGLLTSIKRSPEAETHRRSRVANPGVRPT